MKYDCVIIGAGIGGLTAAALLSVRGFNVCVIEKQASAGGCARTIEERGYRFESGAGLYTLWQKGEIHSRIFGEIGVEPPQVRQLNPSFVVRLPDTTDVVLSSNRELFFQTLSDAFPECSKAAISFYKSIDELSKSFIRTLGKAPDFFSASKLRQAITYLPEFRKISKIITTRTLLSELGNTSDRFRSFIDAQLHLFSQSSSSICPLVYGALSLSLPLSGCYSIQGGPSEHSLRLIEGIKGAGGTIRFNQTVYKINLNNLKEATGVVLLNGERIESRSVLSNLTLWDTYGKLIGPGSTDKDTRHKLKRVRSSSAYLIYASIEESAAKRLPAEKLIIADDWNADDESTFFFNMAPEWDKRAPEGQRAVTAGKLTDPDLWFEYTEDISIEERLDQELLERFWKKLHKGLPELGSSIQPIETETPVDFYQNTRRQLGRVWGYSYSEESIKSTLVQSASIPGLFHTGDTTYIGQGLSAVSYSALVAANLICNRLRR
jgi:phytoene dehydrogenase-like protein